MSPFAFPLSLIQNFLRAIFVVFTFSSLLDMLPLWSSQIEFLHFQPIQSSRLAFRYRKLETISSTSRSFRLGVGAYRINFPSATPLKLEYASKTVQAFPFPLGKTTRNGITAYRWGDGSEAFGFLQGGEITGRLQSQITELAKPDETRMLAQTYVFVCKLTSDIPTCLRIGDGCQSNNSPCTQVGSLAYLNTVYDNLQNETNAKLWKCTAPGYYRIWIASSVHSVIHAAVIQGFLEAKNPSPFGWDILIQMPSEQIFSWMTLFFSGIAWATILILALWHFLAHRKEAQLYRVPRDVLFVIGIHLLMCVVYVCSIDMTGAPHYVGEPLYTSALILSAISNSSWYYLLFHISKGISILRCRLGSVETLTRNVSIVFVVLAEIWNALGGFGSYVGSVTVSLTVYLHLIVIARKTLYRLEAYVRTLRDAGDEDASSPGSNNTLPLSPIISIRPFSGVAETSSRQQQNSEIQHVVTTSSPTGPAIASSNEHGVPEEHVRWNIPSPEENSPNNNTFVLRDNRFNGTETTISRSTFSSTHGLNHSPTQHSPTSPTSRMGARMSDIIQQMLSWFFPYCLSHRSPYAPILRPIPFFDKRWKPIEILNSKYAMINSTFMIFSVSVFMELLIKVFDCINVSSSPFPQLALSQISRLILTSVLLYVFRMNQWPFVIQLNKQLAREILN